MRGERWIGGETISLSIGQGANLTTPIQLAVAYAAIANGGRIVQPRVVLRRETWDGVVVDETQPTFLAENIIAQPILEMVKEGLTRVVMDPTGTGRRARVPGIVVAGKSGTTQVVSLDFVEGLEPEEIPIRYRDHALFVAFAPVESPEIVVVAIAEHAGGGGGSVAAPMVQKVLAKYFEKSERRIPSQLAAVTLGGLR
jgi:penicillin-binding protein 2